MIKIWENYKIPKIKNLNRKFKIKSLDKKRKIKSLKINIKDK